MQTEIDAMRDLLKQRTWGSYLVSLVMNPRGNRDGLFVAGTASATQKCQALVAAYEALGEKQ